MMWLAAGITSIAIAGNEVVSASLDGKVRSKQLIASKDYELYAVTASANRIAFCGNSRDINVGERIFKIPAGWCLALDFSPDGRTLAVGTTEKQVELFDVATGNILRQKGKFPGGDHLRPRRCENPQHHQCSQPRDQKHWPRARHHLAENGKHP